MYPEPKRDSALTKLPHYTRGIHRVSQRGATYCRVETIITQARMRNCSKRTNSHPVYAHYLFTRHYYLSHGSKSNALFDVLSHRHSTARPGLPGTPSHITHQHSFEFTSFSLCFSRCSFTKAEEHMQHCTVLYSAILTQHVRVHA